MSLKPSFFTLAMWFAWLLRRDARVGAALDDEDAQREFVAWWLLHGGAEYPAVWWYGEAQVRVAMELVPCDEVMLPRLLRRVWHMRGDLQATMGFTDLLCWYRLSGPGELPLAPALPDAFMRHSERMRHGVNAMAAALHARTPALRELFDLRSPAARDALNVWYERGGRRLVPAPTDPPAGVEPLPPPRGARAEGPPGVNLVGFARAEFGIGEDVRSASAALAAAGVAHGIYEVPLAGPVRQRDGSRAGFIRESRPFPVSVFCLTAFDMAHVYLQRGPALFSGTYIIGYWPWELPVFPAVWHAAFALVDEVWAASRFQYDAYRAATSLPVRWVPPAVIVPRFLGARRTGGKFRFLVPFDPNSFLSRKNPVAAVRAFRRAFPASERDVELVLRVNGDPSRAPGWRELRAAAAGDRRIRIITGTMDRRAALRLLAGADCLVSPHRAEGFGRNIAEAAALGVRILATGWSGPVDFVPRAGWLRYRMVRVANGAYPFAEGQLWAEPIVADIARAMRVVRHSKRPRVANTHVPNKIGKKIKHVLF